MFAEESARDIMRANCYALEPSARFVLALHHGLIYNPTSPAGSTANPLHMMARLDSLFDSLLTPMHHTFDDNKALISRYYHFIVRSREVTARTVRRFGLEADPYLLWHNMVAHAVDHNLMYEALDNEYWFSSACPSFITHTYIYITRTSN